MILEEYNFKKVVKEQKVCIELPKDWIGKEVEIIVKPVDLLNLKAIQNELTLLIQDLFWVSESDEPFELMNELQIPENTRIEKWVVDKLNLDKPIEIATIDFFFKNVIVHHEWQDEAAKESVDKFKRIYQLFQTKFEETIVLRSGDFEKTILIVGKTADNELVILKTKSIES